MEPDLRDLYQQVIIDHSKSPRNFKQLDEHNHNVVTKEGFNPLCGDKIKLYMACDNGLIKEVAFQGSGCAISMASASMMTAAVKNRTTEQAQELFTNMKQMLTGNVVSGYDYGNLGVFSGVSEFPVRVKCATLPWHTLNAAIMKADGTVSTEEENAG